MVSNGFNSDPLSAVIISFFAKFLFFYLFLVEAHRNLYKLPMAMKLYKGKVRVGHPRGPILGKGDRFRSKRKVFKKHNIKFVRTFCKSNRDLAVAFQIMILNQNIATFQQQDLPSFTRLTSCLCPFNLTCHLLFQVRLDLSEEIGFSTKSG